VLVVLLRFVLAYQRRDFYRHARYVHGWLSAFAFLMLMFFAATGLMLNHPEWFEGERIEDVQILTLPASLGQHIATQENPSDVILQYIRTQQSVIGRYQSSEIMDGDVMIRLESPAGSTDIWVNRMDQQIEITQKPATAVNMLNDLHRGKHVSTAWRWLIDVSAIVVMLLSVAGYVLFLTIKTRLLAHLSLTALSIATVLVLLWSAV
jgi:uncharacterized protein